MLLYIPNHNGFSESSALLEDKSYNRSSVEAPPKKHSIYICVGDPQPEAAGDLRTCLQPKPGASRTCPVCNLVNWEMTYS